MSPAGRGLTEHAWRARASWPAYLLQRWISTAEVAEIDYIASASNKRKALPARLLVRRVPALNLNHQNELFPVYRYHAVFTVSPQPRSKLRPRTGRTPSSSRSSPT